MSNSRTENNDVPPRYTEEWVTEDIWATQGLGYTVALVDDEVTVDSRFVNPEVA
jgi:hypothetical protein